MKDTDMLSFAELYSKEFFNYAIQSKFSEDDLTKEELERVSRLNFLAYEIAENALINIQNQLLITFQAAEDDSCGYLDAAMIGGISLHNHERIKHVREMHFVASELGAVLAHYKDKG